MNRQIKFRGKSVHGYGWLYGNLLVDSDNTFHIISKDIIGFENDNMTIHATNSWIKSSTLSQSLLLKDINSIELYEWDICRITEYANDGRKYFDHDELKEFSVDDMKGEVREEYVSMILWDNACFIVGETRCDTVFDAFFGDQRLSYPIYEIEKIGNRFDNPEMIKEYGLEWQLEERL